jgi:hypothetical protein
MATVSITYPDQYAADAVAALREYLGDDAGGVTDAQAVKKAVKRMVKAQVRAFRRRSAAAVSSAVATADTALADKEATAAAAVRARKEAEDAEDATVEAAFGSDS